MIRNQEAAAESRPNAIIHFSRLVRGILRHCDSRRLRRRQPFQITYSVTVANAAETYRRARRTGSECIKDDPPAAATLVNPRAIFIVFIATTKAQIPWIAALVNAAKDSLTSFVSLWFFTSGRATSCVLACSPKVHPPSRFGSQPKVTRISELVRVFGSL